MKAEEEEGPFEGPPVPHPVRRRLRTFAFDPMSTRLSGRFLHVDVPFELDLKPGPHGKLVQVVDFDAVRDTWYAPVNLNDPWILSQDGLRPTEGDPRSHQQVVYVVAMSVIERFERFMGRRFRWRHQEVLRLVPHAFEGRNAYFDPQRAAVLFGYYRAHATDPGPNLPGQVIFTCLSSDIVAHEVTHAIVHRLRRRYIDPTNPDVFALHEAFADLMAFFQHFIHADVVEEAVAATAGDLGSNSGLLDLAKEFGVSSGRGRALRSAIGTERSPDRFINATEPHERGACFVAAVFDCFLDSHQAAIADLLRIATNGTGVMPEGHLHPDLVKRISVEAVRTADRILGIVVRAFDYLPVVDVDFGDVVRAIVTADRALYPDDGLRLRANLVEAFRRRGIVPRRVSSLTDESLAWPTPDSEMNLNTAEGIDLPALILSATMDLDPEGKAGYEQNRAFSGVVNRRARDKNITGSLRYWLNTHACEVGLDPDVPFKVDGIHVAFREAADRLPRPEIVIQLVQRRSEYEDQHQDQSQRLAVRAGTTLIAGADGRIEYIVAKPLPFTAATEKRYSGERYFMEHQRHGEQRLNGLMEWQGVVQDSDPMAPWTSEEPMARLNFANMHMDVDTGTE